ncbi:MAG: hypothetical protein JSS77_13740 [Acidobacteria bacterium]|nr:hypothetical protein [Acidobacteriota bacterium]
MKIIYTLAITAILVCSAYPQSTIPTIKANSNVVSIQDGDVLKKDSWNLAPEAKPDVYETFVKKGAKRKVEFITDIDTISFDVEAGRTYDFIIQMGETKCYTQIKASELKFWNDPDFWESPSIKTPYKENISNEEKIAGLSKFWSEAKYNFINFGLVPDLDWDKTYLEFIPKVLATTSTLEYYRVLQEFCGKLKDSHTNVYFPKDLQTEVNAGPAITTRLIEGRVIIVGLLDPKLKGDGIEVGQEITAIDGIPARTYANEKVAPYVSENTPQSQETAVYQYFLLRGSVSKPVELTLKDPKGNVAKRTLPRLSRQDRMKLPNAAKLYDLKMLPGNIALVTVNTMADAPGEEKFFKENFAAISKASGVILDLRENGGGNSDVGYNILSYFVDKPFKGSSWYTREYHPTFRPWGQSDKVFGQEAEAISMEQIKQMRNGEQAFLGPFVVLSSPRTFSAAEDFLVAFKPLKRGLIVGEPSGGSTGQPLVISLPGGGTARICSKHDTFADGTEFVGVGVIPDILVRPKVTDFTEGRDAILERAIDELERSKATH